MNLHQIFRPEVTKEGYAARELTTGDLAEDGLIRDIQIKNALKHDQLLRVDGVTGRVRRISKEEGKQEAESVGKMEFKAMRAETDPSMMFTNLERLTGMVAKGIQPSLVVTGMPGLGKTYLVKKKLEEMGLNESRDFVHFKGRSTAAGLFITLFENRNRVVVFDDCDSVFKDDDAVNMLKAALDSYDSRHISYLSSKPLKDPEGDPLPSTFEFTGQIIFISNISQSKLDPAIQSRSFVQDISMTTNQMFQRILFQQLQRMFCLRHILHTVV